MDKKKFIKEDFTKFVSSLQPEAKGKWGKMNAQQMVEHMSDYMRIANGKTKVQGVLTPEQTHKSYSFMMSEKSFRENTPNQLLPDVPPPFRNASMADAIKELQNEIDHFFVVFSGNEAMRFTSPFFGDLNFEEQVQLLHKHATHHARQFGLVE
jgi:hypothetical protein